ncbi:MAG: Zn-ribbon domain-containing OB-fold protein [Anaerolineae bacterium]
MRVADWRTNKQRLALVGEVCPHCSAKLFPPRDVCPKCHGPAKEEFHFSGKGSVYSYSTMYAAPEGFGSYVPYVVAWVKLVEGPMVTAQLTDVEGEKVYIGMPVEMVTRKMHDDGDAGLIAYNYKFRPLLESLAS